jgi:hypothetical protein
MARDRLPSKVERMPVAQRSVPTLVRILKVLVGEVHLTGLSARQVHQLERGVDDEKKIT